MTAYTHTFGQELIHGQKFFVDITTSKSVLPTHALLIFNLRITFHGVLEKNEQFLSFPLICITSLTVLRKLVLSAIYIKIFGHFCRYD